ncbi:beta-fructofuranosidase, insoluble isoenzyme CWINV6-like isoform X1 [Rhodamnia argentea]|uniref:Beta-fructofuranosidase, insoluble isoenzyme CWINV6-like isoform X1 n=1 Tax=Rhodamnia argentea TaxID=178133 RepID=A0A8B8R1R0_9MYRT|nr:beta-fructofuranosidase, insoluble isoenzyme CWINV6-like isoform X1 [Rhodamnia argentea]
MATLFLAIACLCCALLSCGIGAELEGSQSRSIAAAREQPYRTSYHFQSPRNWLNDPNGLMYYKGVYHLFYQYNPHSALFSNGIVWAHSVSYDLVNWVHLNHALEPSEPFDVKSCWSGSATILPGSRPVILYTGIDANYRQVQNLAIPKNESDPFLQEWVKFSQNPIIVPPIGIEPDNFRDPTTAWWGPDGKWRIIVGSWRDNIGMAILYQSDDFFHWSKSEHPLFTLSNTSMWECPDFFPVSTDSTNGMDTSTLNPSTKHVMKASFNSHDYYVLGTYNLELERFSPDDDLKGASPDLRLDYGKYYASKSFFDSAKNRRILFGWVNESDSTEDDIAKGWSGLQAFPREIWLDRSGKQLIQWPVEEIKTLRDKNIGVKSLGLDGGSTYEVSNITASQVDVEVAFELPKLEEAELMDPNWVDPQILCSEKNASVGGMYGPFGLLALATKDLREQTAIFFRVFRGHNRYIVLMCSDQSRSSLRNEIDKTIYGAFLDIDPQVEKISLRTLIDHSIIESFGGEGKVCITSRVYPVLAIDEAARVYTFNYGTLSVRIERLDAWSMRKARIGPGESLVSQCENLSFRGSEECPSCAASPSHCEESASAI